MVIWQSVANTMSFKEEQSKRFSETNSWLRVRAAEKKREISIGVFFFVPHWSCLSEVLNSNEEQQCMFLQNYHKKISHKLDSSYLLLSIALSSARFEYVTFSYWSDKITDHPVFISNFIAPGNTRKSLKPMFTLILSTICVWINFLHFLPVFQWKSTSADWFSSWQWLKSILYPIHIPRNCKYMLKSRSRQKIMQFRIVLCSDVE